MQKTTQSSEVAETHVKKHKASVMKKFESSKRKFEKVSRQREAKRRTVMVDFHDMSKPSNDPRAPRRCRNIASRCYIDCYGIDDGRNEKAYVDGVAVIAFYLQRT
ncbi:hypothetical protein HAX54_028944, partial [Datura stramonium]|nr:hypothetical protein [Datura stramonium]